MKYSLYTFLTILVSFSLGYLTAFATASRVSGAVATEIGKLVDRRFDELEAEIKARMPKPETIEELKATGSDAWEVFREKVKGVGSEG